MGRTILDSVERLKNVYNDVIILINLVTTLRGQILMLKLVLYCLVLPLVDGIAYFLLRFYQHHSFDHI